MRETVHKLSCFLVNVLAIRNTLFLTIFYTFAFCAFQFATCLMNVMAAFRRHAFLAFPSIKREKQRKQHAVFLMYFWAFFNECGDNTGILTTEGDMTCKARCVSLRRLGMNFVRKPNWKSSVATDDRPLYLRDGNIRRGSIER